MKTYIRRLFAPLAHPVGGFDDYRERRFFPLLPSLIVLALFFFARVAQQQLTGFIFNWDNPATGRYPPCSTARDGSGKSGWFRRLR